MKFNVIVYDFNSKEFKSYDVIPYFLNCYKKERPKPKTLKEIKDFIIRKSQYMFWSRCEWEILLAPWPYGSFNIKEQLKTFVKDNPELNLEDYSISNKFYNIITSEMIKIDVHQQIMSNIDIVVDVFKKSIK
jgi:hypothetical protein